MAHGHHAIVRRPGVRDRSRRGADDARRGEAIGARMDCTQCGNSKSSRPEVREEAGLDVRAVGRREIESFASSEKRPQYRPDGCLYHRPHAPRRIRIERLVNGVLQDGAKKEVSDVLERCSPRCLFDALKSSPEILDLLGGFYALLLYGGERLLDASRQLLLTFCRENAVCMWGLARIGNKRGERKRLSRVWNDFRPNVGRFQFLLDELHPRLEVPITDVFPRVLQRGLLWHALPRLVLGRMLATVPWVFVAEHTVYRPRLPFREVHPPREIEIEPAAVLDSYDVLYDRVMKSATDNARSSEAAGIDSAIPNRVPYLVQLMSR